MHSDQGPAGRYIDGRGKLKKIFAAVVLAANENGNGKRQSNPLAAFGSRLVAFQILSPVQLESDTSGTSWAKLMMRNGKEDIQMKGEAIELAKVLCFCTTTLDYLPSFVLNCADFLDLELERIYRK